MRLYLASTSPARLATLRAAGVEPVLLSPGVDEDAVVEAERPRNAVDMVQLLARVKAEAVIGRTVDGAPIDGFILGGDSAFELDGAVYGKPHTADVAWERWRLQRGREGLLHSGHWLIDHRGGSPAASGVIATGGVSTATVRFADDITDDELHAYIATGEPLRVAGAFTIDSLGAPFIESVDGDPHAVVGLSLALLRKLVGRFGVAWPALWNRVP
ncbi:Maf family protein [Lysobacter korlensis]|uniref:Nucleoside triphosphate pyrophosphatase n=1 Tax=Lysobacter korlensis TaxID=553636 RepID=A0ABV6RZL1_9GAMM